MKKLLSLLVLGSVCISYADPLYIPETSDEQNTIAFMEKGQIAYIPNADGTTARLMIGNGTIQPYPVMDPAVLRGKSSVLVSTAEVEIQISSQINYADGIYYIENRNPLPGQDPTYTGKIEASMTIHVENKNISKITWNENGDDFAGRFAYDPSPDIKVEYKGNTATISWTQDPMSIGRIWNIQCYYSPEYMNYVNDTTDIDYYIKDTHGTSYLSTWRQYCIDYWRTRHQLATNWAEHVANSDIKINKQFVRWDSRQNTIFSTKFDNTTENLVTYAKGMPIMTLVGKGGESSASGSLIITAVTPNQGPSSNQFKIEFEESVTGFDISKLELWTSDALESDLINWLVEKPVSVTYNSSTHQGTIMCNMNTNGGNRKFYKLKYDTIQSGVYQVVFRADVLTKGLILRSTSGNTWWRIKVDDSGNLTTEQVTENLPSW